ncbi:hypothetical protein BDAP_000061 [Binucleata daphniae]
MKPQKKLKIGTNYKKNIDKIIKTKIQANEMEETMINNSKDNARIIDEIEKDVHNEKSDRIDKKNNEFMLENNTSLIHDTNTNMLVNNKTIVNNIINSADKNKATNDEQLTNTITAMKSEKQQVNTGTVTANDEQQTNTIAAIKSEEQQVNTSLVTTNKENDTNFVNSRYCNKKEPIIEYRRIYKKLYFSKYLYKLSNIYSAILTVQRFNKQKNLKCIYTKCKKSIEEMIKDIISIKHIEQINYFVDCECKKINITHEGKETNTFTFDFVECNFDFMIWCFICEKYESYMKTKNKEHIGNKFAKEFDTKSICDLPRKRLFGTTPNYTAACTNTSNNTYNISNNSNTNNISINTNKISTNAHEQPHLKETNNQNTVMTAKEKANAILQRIKDKERKRKEEFVSMQAKNDEIDELKNKIDTLFALENKTKLPIEKVVKVVNIFNGKKSIEKLCTRYAEYKICTINDEVFLTKK